MRRLLWRLRLCVAIPVVMLGCWLEDFGVWLANLSHRIEGDEP